MRTRAAAKGKMTPTKRGRLQRVAEDLMGISTIDFFNYVSENSPTRDFERAYTTLGFGDEPLSREEAMARPDWDKWNKAENIEYKALKDRRTFKWVPIDKVPLGKKIIKCKWVYKRKPDRYKARLDDQG